ncbi:MAG: LysM peptidoglycan-binding domain-containing protein [Muribaculum sp.]|nr:LysM peptidoglycan-binding domain-containing protein [Muribaculum sp.]
MKRRRLYARSLVGIMALFMAVMTAFAQTTTVKHIVARGETLEDIAKTYNITKEDIISANPSAGQFVYVGMELIIPQKVQQTFGGTNLPNNSNNDPRMDGYNNGSVPGSNSGSKPSENSANRESDGGFSYWGLGYMADFEAADKGAYGIYFRAIAPYHFGMDFGAYANYGIVDKDYAGLQFLIGPAIGSRFDGFRASVALDAIIAAMDDPEKSDIQVNWGLGLFPQLAFELSGNTCLVVGLYGNWAKGADKLSFGFHAGLAF